MEIIELLQFTKKNGASDLHISPEMPPCIRLHGDITPFLDNPLSAEEIRRMLYSVMTDGQRTAFERDMELDFALQFGTDMRFRANAFITSRGPAMVFRVIPTEILSMEQLNLPTVMYRLTELHKGLVLVTGPTGSGKSTTLAAIINEVNKNHKKHIITIEDPIEFVHKPIKCVINQRELHSNTKSFAAALKSSLREDPDVILVGEMRDVETISLALTAAETGHLVFGTLHTSSAAKTVDRIIDVFPAEDKELVRSMFASSIQAVIAQTLMKKIDGKGRVAGFEIMLGTPSVRNLIRENKIPQLNSMIQIGSKFGMVAMKDYINNLVKESKISQETASSVLNLVSQGADFEEKAGAVASTLSVNPNTVNKPTPPAATSEIKGDF